MPHTMSFWTDKRPLFVLAPMANVTDAAFRRVIAKYGKPDVTFTQFVSCDGLCSAGREALLPDLWFHDAERPIVAQFFGANPETFFRCARLAVELGFDGIDLNMGCPDKNVLKQGAGAGLIGQPQRAREVIRAAKEGAGGLPVSVKTRLGRDRIELDTWLPHLLSEGVAALSVHLRTRAEMSKVPAHWELAGEIAMLGRAYATSVFGNGDVTSLEEAREKTEAHGLDGVMLGRAIFGNPWCFNPEVRKEDLPLETVLATLLEHTALYDELYGEIKPFEPMRKHFASYLSGFSHIKPLRQRLTQSACLDDVRVAVADWVGTGVS